MVDPLCTVLFSVIVMFTTVRIMRDSFAIIMDAVPADVDVRQLSGRLADVPGVRAVHDLCVWSVTVGWPVMAVHLVVGKCLSVCNTFAAERNRFMCTETFQSPTAVRRKSWPAPPQWHARTLAFGTAPFSWNGATSRRCW